MKPFAFAGLSLTAILFACSAESTTEPEQVRMTLPTRPVRDVLGATLVQLGVEARVGELSAPELRTNVGLLPGEAEAGQAADASPGAGDSDSAAPSPPLDPELVELREGLIGMVTGSPRQLNIAKKDIAHLKDEIGPVMAAGFDVEGRSPEELRILMDLAVMSPTLEVAEAIARVAFAHEEDWLRRYAAWSLASFGELPEADRLIPGLLRRLKYERDPEALVWIASTLASFDNYAGVEAMYQTTARPSGDAAGDAARTQLAAALQRATEARGKEETLSTNAVKSAWNLGLLGRSREQTTESLLGEIWLLLADMSGEHFQLRGVDDARHVLSLLGPWAASEFALALEDDDEYVRLHTAQVLERMHARGSGAFDSLQAALLDPHQAVAGAAAEALVAVTKGTQLAASAKGTLLARIDAVCPYEVKVACVRALGQMDPKTVPTKELRSFFQETNLSDLRLAAAPGLLTARTDPATILWLIAELENSAGDPSGAEDVVGDWLKAASVAADAPPDIVAAKAAWDAEAAPMSVVHTAEQARARRGARAAALAESLAGRLAHYEKSLVQDPDPAATSGD